jgi:hypothetical protein
MPTTADDLSELVHTLNGNHDPVTGRFFTLAVDLLPGL